MDIDSGAGSGFSSAAYYVTTHDNHIYFRGYQSTTGAELWRTDGTEAGTNIVMDIDSGAGNGFSSSAYYLFTRNNYLYFRGYQATTGAELWRTDGTEAGTNIVMDIDPGTGNGFSSAAYYVDTLNDYIYFRGYQATTGAELWRTDGTEAGTNMVMDIDPGTGNGFSSSAYYLFTLNNYLYFRGYQSTTGAELWRTDGTEAGTNIVMDIDPGVGNGFSSAAYYVTTLDNYIYFRGYQSTTGAELWRTDGTEAGTNIVMDIDSGTGNGFSSSSYYLFTQNNYIYFRGYQTTTGAELWRTDGTEAGTNIVMDIDSGAGNGFSSSANYVTTLNDIMYFLGYNASTGSELWAYLLPTNAKILGENQICIGDSVILTGTGGIQYQWFPNSKIDCDTCQQITVYPDSSMSLYLVAFSENGLKDTAVMQITVIDCQRVYPGDANHDGICDNYDLLPIGLYYSDTGSARAIVSIEWKGFDADDWSILQADSTNLKHADCNGDGAVNLDDIEAITNNFGEVASKSALPTSNADAELILKLSTPEVNVGKSYSLYLLTESTTLNLYGFAFDISFNADIISLSSLSLNYDSCWLSVGDPNFMTFENISESDQVVYGALSRSDKTTQSSTGVLSVLKFELDSANLVDSNLVFTVLKSKGVTSTGQEVTFDISNATDTAKVILNPTSAKQRELNKQLEVSPNPCGDYLNIDVNSAVNKPYIINIYDLQGIKVYEKHIAGNGLEVLDISILNSGVYLLIMEEMNGGRYYKKVIKN